MADFLSNPIAWASLAPALALLGALVNGLFGARTREPGAGIVASALVGLAFLVSLISFIALAGSDRTAVNVTLWNYLSTPELQLSLGFLLDRLSLLLMLVVTGVGFLIHVYSIGYMHGDDGYSRYFAALNLFVASMLVLIMADSYLLMFVGWEGVGVCSYLLIGFWYRDRLNADAARKAFIVNRIGDVGFLLAMFLGFGATGTLNIVEFNAVAASMAYGSVTLTIIGFLFLLAACGKSAQLPLQVWLPDAMAGPTPVSALIHAATMVTAGVYLVVRSAPLYAQAPDAAATVAWVGGLTALVAAISALAQTDIKKILAYSTISQLGFMFAAAGAGAHAAAIFHLFTHAFFKALLFLAAGSVIHALAGEQDVRKMGGLGRTMKVTGTTALIATLAISGVPLLAGFFSKDAVLAGIYTSEWLREYGGVGLYLVLLATAVLTAFYMFRWYFLVFAGTPRLDKSKAAHVHEAPSVMTVPLLVLAALTVLAGYLGLPAFAFPNLIAQWLDPVTDAGIGFLHPSLLVEWTLVGASAVAAAVGIGLAWLIYGRGAMRRLRRVGDGPAGRFAGNGLGFDGLYRTLFIRGGEGVAGGISVLDRDLVDRSMTGFFGGVTGLAARAATAWQAGFVRIYAFSMLAGALVLLVIAFIVSGVFA